MQSQDFILGKFIAECKNRFLCTVEIDGAKERCYIASSCRLDNFIDLKGKTVLLSKNKAEKSATKYSVLGVKHKHSYILLNTSLANAAIKNSITSRRLACFGKRTIVKKETMVEDYKADFFIPDTNTLIEVKSVISTASIAEFPTVYSERTVQQLDTIERLLHNNYLAHFVIVSLNPYVKQIRLLNGSEFYERLARCMNCGLKLHAFTCKMSPSGVPCINKSIPIIMHGNIP